MRGGESDFVILATISELYFVFMQKTVLAKMKSCFEDLRSETFQWGKKGLFSKKKGTKKGLSLELFKTLSRYFRNNE